MNIYDRAWIGESLYYIKRDQSDCTEDAPDPELQAFREAYKSPDTYVEFVMGILGGTPLYLCMVCGEPAAKDELLCEECAGYSEATRTAQEGTWPY